MYRDYFFNEIETYAALEITHLETYTPLSAFIDRSNSRLKIHRNYRRRLLVEKCQVVWACQSIPFLLLSIYERSIQRGKGLCDVCVCGGKLWER